MVLVPFYVLLGESNSGWTPFSLLSPQDQSKYSGTISQTEIWNPGRGAFSAVIEDMQPGVNTMCENYADLTQFGLEVSFFKLLQNQKPRKRLLFKQGQANTSIVIDWKPTFPYNGGNGGRFSQLTQWLPMAAEQAYNKGYTLDLRAVMWIGGENDSKEPGKDRAPQYFNSLKDLFTGFNNLWNGIAAQYGFPKTNYKKVIGRVYAPGAAFPYRDVVRAAQEAFCADAANNAVLINTDKYGLFDYAHYDGPAMVQYGTDVFNAAKYEDEAGVSTAQQDVSFSGKVFLQGAYNAGTGMMNNTLNTSGILQASAATQPYNGANFKYTGTESVGANFFASHPDIVDWILIELRDAANPASVVAAKAAFVKTDGTILDVNGTETRIAFPGVAPGSYHVAIKHRNHLGIRSAAPVNFAAGNGNYDFTTAGNKSYQNQSYSSTVQMAGAWVMRGGNADSNTSVKYNGPENDQNRILNGALQGSKSNILTNVYASEDVNMDGTIKVNGPGNEQDFLLNTVLGGSMSIIYNEQI